MSKNQNRKGYAITVVVKPSSVGTASYKPITFKGVTVANSPTKAKEMTTEMILQQYKDYDGSSITKPFITKEHITFKQCELYTDFYLYQQKDQ